MDKKFLKNLNNEQLEYVQMKGDNVLISASAGTGKTSTMVIKLLSLIVEEKIPVKKLLVVTFTNAAASEMKQRLYSALLAYAQNCEDSEKEYIFSQLEDLNNSDIGTIHSICKRWIVKFFTKLKIDPTFSLLDENESSFLFNIAVDNIFNKLTIEKDEDFYILFNCFNSDRGNATLKTIIKKIITFTNSKIDVEEWKQNIFKNSLSTNFNENVCCKFLFDYAKAKFMNFAEEFTSLKNHSIAIKAQKFTEYIQNRLNFILEIGDCQTYFDICKTLSFFNFIRKPSLPKNCDDVDLIDFNDKVVNVSKIFDDEKKQLKKFFFEVVQNSEESISKWEKEMQFVGEIIKKLFSLCELVSEEYSKIKNDKNALDFEDIEHFAYHLILDEEIKNELKNTYDQIFIDEYQDVNEYQEAILCGIEKNKNLNMIGDVKQSIYAFRRSTPKIFVDKYNDYSEGKNGSVVYFNKNYRSCNNILQFVNHIFKKLITKQTIGIDYASSSKLVSGFDGESIEKSVSLSIVNSKREDDECEKIEKKELIKTQCFQIVKHIQNLVGTSYSIGDEKRVYSYRDIAILLRNKGDFLNELIKTLVEFNIPVNASYRIDLFSQIEVIYIISFLKVLNNRFEDVSLVTLLKGEMANFNENELLEISKIEANSFYEKMLAFNSGGELMAKITKFLAKLNSYSFYYETHSLIELLHKFINDNDLMLFYRSLPNGYQRESNIKAVLQLASAQTYANNLYGFLNYIDSIQEKNYELEINSSNDCVQIITMHGSKGLGYPAIIVADMGTNFRINSNTSDCILNDRFGLGIKYKDLQTRTQQESIIQKACTVSNKISEMNEEIRLLYVALTRAKNNLFLIGSYNLNSLAGKKFNDVYDSKSFLDLLFYSLDHHARQHFINKKQSFTLNDGIDSQFDVKLIFDDLENVTQNSHQSPLIIRELDSDLVERGTEWFNIDYNKFKDCAIVKKNSVSSLLVEEKDYQLNLERFRNLNLFDEFLKEDEEIASEIGIIYHKIMENFSFLEEKSEVIEKSVAFLQNCNSAVAEQISIDKVCKAFDCVKRFVDSKSIVKKEMQFIMKVPHNEIVKNSKINEKIIVQGVADLLIINGNDAIIIDFKSNKKRDKFFYISTYKTQLFLYKVALEKIYKNVKFKCFIYSFECGELIDMNE